MSLDATLKSGMDQHVFSFATPNVAADQSGRTGSSPMDSTTSGQSSIETAPVSEAGKKKSRPTVVRAVSVKSDDSAPTTEAPAAVRVAPAAKPGVKKKKTRKKKERSNGSAPETRKRGRKSYPVVGFADVIGLGEGIMRHNAGLPVKRETLLGTMKLELNALSTRNLITNSNKYGLTEGSYSAPTLKLTPKGRVAVDSKAKRIDQMKARFELAIADVPEFNLLYEKRNGSNMPAPEMLHDDLQDVDSGDRKPCADVFISNAKYLGLLTERDGAQYLMTVDEWLGGARVAWTPPSESASPLSAGDSQATGDTAVTDYDRICFVLSTIKDTGSEERKHADMVLSQYVERALEGTGLKPVRADKIGDPGMISKQIIEHIVHSKLVLADLSFHNPNVFYELALRHVTGKATVHLIQDSDRIPFDIGNFRTIKIDTNDKYKMVSELDTLRAEISTAIRQALANGESRDNPILTFCPNAKFVMNGQI